MSGANPRKKLLSTENGKTIRIMLPEPTGTQIMPLYSLDAGNRVLCMFSFGFWSRLSPVFLTSLSRCYFTLYHYVLEVRNSHFFFYFTEVRS